MVTNPAICHLVAVNLLKPFFTGSSQNVVRDSSKIKKLNNGQIDVAYHCLQTEVSAAAYYCCDLAAPRVNP